MSDGQQGETLIKQLRNAADSDELRKTVGNLQDDVESLENACWDCCHPDCGDPEPHVHPPDGKHWHHYIDPGDGLPSPCKNSDMLNRITEPIESRLAAAVALLKRAKKESMFGISRQAVDKIVELLEGK